VEAAASFQIPTNGSGTWTTPGHAVTESGYYTWIAEWVGGDAAVANHTCGDVSETVLVNPTISTHTSHPTIDAGGELTDTITLAGPTAASQGTVVAHLYGPLDQDPVGNSDACTDAPVAYTETLTVGGAGTYNTTPVVVGDHGWYTWVVEYNGGDGTTATHDCGLAAESTIVNPVIATQVTDSEIIEGDSIADAALVGGIGANTPGRITAQAFGPFGAGDQIECSAATEATTMIFDVIGPGEHVSPTWVPPTAGVYTFVETWEILTPPSGWPADTTP
ncbi:MAG: hypothetical protein GY799_04695, partial [Desulfobulbaceae bacterium]|nr:hypothetical protein [Desulfobulbaceae bacterium]